MNEWVWVGWRTIQMSGKNPISDGFMRERESLVCFVINLALLIKHLEFIVFMWSYAASTLLPQGIRNQSNSVINN